MLLLFVGKVNKQPCNFIKKHMLLILQCKVHVCIATTAFSVFHSNEPWASLLFSDSCTLWRSQQTTLQSYQEIPWNMYLKLPLTLVFSVQMNLEKFVSPWYTGPSRYWGGYKVIKARFLWYIWKPKHFNDICIMNKKNADLRHTDPTIIYPFYQIPITAGGKLGWCGVKS